MILLATPIFFLSQILNEETIHHTVNCYGFPMYSYNEHVLIRVVTIQMKEVGVGSPPSRLDRKWVQS